MPGKVTVNMPRAREIHKEKLRIARGPKLAELDVVFMRQLERGEDTTETVNAKQRLRDLTADPQIENAQSPNALRGLWPVNELGPSPYKGGNQSA